MIWLHRTGRLLACAMFACLGSVAVAQNYPTQVVRILVPYAPGGAPDLIARTLTPRLSENFGQQFIVENKPGASGITAAQEVTRSPADGHLLLLSDIQQLAINPFLFSKLPYDPVKDFLPVSLAATVPLYIAVQSSLNVNSLSDLARLAKESPGAFTYGSPGNGSIHHIAMEVLKTALGLDIVHVPYRGAAPSVLGLLRGDTLLVIAAMPSLAPHVEAGKVKLLAATTLKRAAQAPNVATVSDLVPGFDFGSEMGFAVRAGTQSAIVDRLSREISASLKDPATAQRLAAAGAVLFGTSADEYQENIRLNLIKFEKAVRLSGAKSE